jgi:hypothetical protein
MLYQPAATEFDRDEWFKGVATGRAACFRLGSGASLRLPDDYTFPGEGSQKERWAGFISSHPITEASRSPP